MLTWPAAADLDRDSADDGTRCASDIEVPHASAQAAVRAQRPILDCGMSMLTLKRVHAVGDRSDCFAPRTKRTPA